MPHELPNPSKYVNVLVITSLCWQVCCVFGDAISIGWFASFLRDKFGMSRKKTDQIQNMAIVICVLIILVVVSNIVHFLSISGRRTRPNRGRVFVAKKPEAVAQQEDVD